jgi:hypothetical protein
MNATDEFIIAARGGTGDLDAWLEVNSEKEICDVLLPILRQRDELIQAAQRAETQMTLGDLIAKLETLPSDTQVANLCNPDSYRGYYSDLYFECAEGTRPSSELLAECKAAMGKVFIGYKGGEFMMGAATPLWIATYGNCGMKLMEINDDGTILTMEDE